jgi:parallel beta-helix repeat protein/predicted outer membrane repeat protein
VTIAHSTITNNDAAESGGGIYAEGEAETITISDCTVSDNTAGRAGGGIAFAFDGSTLALADSNIIGKWAQSGGGVSEDDGVPGSMLTVTNVIFARNNATQDSGGLALSGNGTLTNTVFAQNSAATNGGGFSAYPGFRATQASVHGVYVIQNAAGEHGGGVYNTNNLSGTGLVIANNQPDNCFETQGASGCP